MILNKAAGRIPSHRWVVVSDPKQDSDQVIIVNFTTLRDNDPDETCVVKPSQYPGLGHDSYVKYSEAICTTASKLEEGIRVGALSPSRPVPLELLNRIRAGFVTSKHVRRTHRDLLRHQRLIP
ncbi:MAG: hypothetical protein HY721_31000 [Planctomycetes bacterium]|nr:hypothetical protein [Planctomycetota bacterium]